ncbi:MAG TPA: glycosyltransferase [Actinomycetota bacterium]|nr:glycosyltransferase [Actinomycetota bacterium]
MRRVALISEHASPLAALGGVDSGGQNVYVGQLARHLARIGHDVDVFTRRDRQDLPPVAEWLDGVRIVHVPAGPPHPIRKEELLPWMPRFAAYMRQFIERRGNPYDILHANFWMSGLVAAELKRSTGVPYVVTFHALGRVRRLHLGEDDGFPDERFGIEERVIADADQVVAECPQDEEDLIRLYGADPTRITVIPAGFDPAELSPMGSELARATLGLPPRERIVLHLGRIVPRKGVEDVIRAFARLVDRHRVAARLYVAGGDAEAPHHLQTPEVRRLRSIAHEEGVDELVTFLGPVRRDQLKLLYGAADVFVTTPWYEPFGITPLEAMACGTPVIGSNVGGVKFSVRDGETGYLVPPRDPDATAERLARLLSDDRLLALFRRQAIRRANDLFTWRKVASDVAALYERVLLAGDVQALERADEVAAIERALRAPAEAFTRSRELLTTPILSAVGTMSDALRAGGKIIVCGNGGPGAEAEHFVAELVGRFRQPDHPALAAFPLGGDVSTPTAWSNVGDDRSPERQVEALGRPGDVLVGLSTSGRSGNLVRVFQVARDRGMRVVGLLGGDGGEMRRLTDVAVIVPATDTQRIQEVQLVLANVLAELLEDRLFGSGWVEPADEGRATIHAAG